MPVSPIRDIRGQWPFPDVGDARKAGNPCWFETDESTYWEMLECLPPIYAAGGFMMSEAASHDGKGIAIRAYFVQSGSRYFVREVSEAHHPAAYAELMGALRAESAAC